MSEKCRQPYQLEEAEHHRGLPERHLRDDVAPQQPEVAAATGERPRVPVMDARERVDSFGGRLAAGGGGGLGGNGGNGG